MAALFAAFYFIPFDALKIWQPISEALLLAQEYAREHVLLCLIPAFFIAGGIAAFISGDSVIKYFGARANKFVSYSVASVSGSILAACSCTVLPLFAGIYTRGAGLGPATAFLYSAPAINVLAIILTARVLGFEYGLARGIGAIVFAVVIGLVMHIVFLREENKRIEDTVDFEICAGEERPVIQNIVLFILMIAFLIFANLRTESIVWQGLKFVIAGVALVLLIILAVMWLKKDEGSMWLSSTWGFAVQMVPLLLVGILISGFLLGRPGHQGVIPSQWVEQLVGGNSFGANFFASVVGAFMYFATLTEIPILEGLIGAGMGKGPALALLLAGPALSLPNMLVIRSVIGTKKTVVYVSLVIIMATISGLVFGVIAV
jgi:hypothetical protein